MKAFSCGIEHCARYSRSSGSDSGDLHSSNAQHTDLTDGVLGCGERKEQGEGASGWVTLCWLLRAAFARSSCSPEDEGERSRLRALLNGAVNVERLSTARVLVARLSKKNITVIGRMRRCVLHTPTVGTSGDNGCSIDRLLKLELACSEHRSQTATEMIYCRAHHSTRTDWSWPGSHPGRLICMRALIAANTGSSGAG